MGTSPFAGVSLRSLIESGGYQISAVVSQPDKPKGRKLRLMPTPVKEIALSYGLPVLQPLSARVPEFVEALRALAPDLIVVAAYGQILPQSILDVPRFGCLNVHGSLLPRHRGAAPIQWAILDGDLQTGITIMKMDAGLDTGDMLSMRSTPVDPNESGAILHDRLALMGGDLLVDTIPRLINGEIKAVVQPESGATYARKLTREDGVIDWTLPLLRIHNKIRALDSWPGASSTLHSPRGDVGVKIWKAIPAGPLDLPCGVLVVHERNRLLVACGAGEGLEILELQSPGSRRLSTAAFLAGHDLSAARFIGGGTQNL